MPIAPSALSRPVLLCMLACAALGCGDDDPPDVGPSSGSGGSGAAGGMGGGGSGGEGGSSVEPLDFVPCDWFTVDVSDAVPVVEDGTCGVASMPLVRDDPSSPDIDVFVKRLPARTQATGQLWLLDGGPGGEGVTMEIYAARFRELLPSFDIFVPHHRGVGSSTRLSCAGEDAASPQGFSMTVAEHVACGEELEALYGDRLRGFSPTEAAHDLAELIARTQAAYDAPVPAAIYGGSYGTYLGLRLAALHPESFDQLILDSTCAPGYCWSADRDKLYDATAQRILARCVAEDPTCAERLGPDPWVTVAAAFQSLEDGDCPGLSQVGIGRDALKVLLGQLVQTTQARVAMAPVIARVQRCDPGDVTAVLHLFDFLFNGPPSSLSGHFGQALYANIVASELYAPGTPDTDAIVAEANALYAARGTTIFTTTLYENWPRYEPDASLSTTVPEVDKPVLLLSGGLDPLTPPDTLAAFDAAFSNPLHQHVVFDDLGHGLVSISLDPDALDGPSCGAQLIAQFAADPTTPVDASCTADTFSLLFDASAEQSQTYFGTDGLWD